MGWEKRGNKQYYYEKRRVGDKVYSKYIGNGPSADLMSALVEYGQLVKSLKQAEIEIMRSELEEDRAVERHLDQIGSWIRTLTSAILLVNGYHTHKGQWRKRGK